MNVFTLRGSPLWQIAAAAAGPPVMSIGRNVMTVFNIDVF